VDRAGGAGPPIVEPGALPVAVAIGRRPPST